MEMEPYKFADLDRREDLLHDIRSLESRMRRELGQEVTLIAYTQEEQDKHNAASSSVVHD